MKCSKCGEEMTTTPVCCGCGIIPIVESSFKRLEDSNRQAASIMRICVSMMPRAPKRANAVDVVLIMEEWLSAYDNKGGKI